MLFQTSCVGTPQQNGRVERKHRHILEVARALRFQASLPIEFWGESVQAVVHLINRTPTKILEGKTPYEFLFGSTPHFDLLKVFGCLCYVHNKQRHKDKFDSRSRKCVFLGYLFGKKGWKVYDLEAKDILISRDVRFLENVFPFSQTPISHTPNFDDVLLYDWEMDLHNVDKGNNVTTTPSQQLAQQSSPAIQQIITSPQHQRATSFQHQPDPTASSSRPQRTAAPTGNTDQQHCASSSCDSSNDVVNLTIPMHSTPLHDSREPTSVDERPITDPPPRVRRPPSWLTDYICHSAQVTPPISREKSPTPSTSSGMQFPIVNYVQYNNFSESHRNFLAAISVNVDPTSYKEASRESRWRKAMQDEIDALERNDTWEIVDLPPGKKPIGSQWVYRTKFLSDGAFERDKARLVALGNHQRAGEDFTDTFAPVAKMVSVRTFLAVAIAKNWEVHQLDVNNAFLHGDLKEEVYMKLPPGFTSTSPNKVCRLRKSLYGLRQSPRNWFAKLTSALRRYGFQQSHANHTLFTLRKGTDILSVLVYVDDILVAGNNSALCSSFKHYLDECFKLKDMGPLKYFLWIECARSQEGMFLCQRKYTLDILAETGLGSCKPVDTPLPQNYNLALASGPFYHDVAQYRRIIGRLIYLTITRPDISYSVHILSQFMKSPRQEHFEAAIRVLRYLKTHPGQGVFLRADNDLQLYAYCDSDWASCPISRRSITGYFLMLGSSPI